MENVFRERNLNGQIVRVQSIYKKVKDLNEDGLIYYNNEQYFFFEHDKGNFLHYDLWTSLNLDENEIVEFSRNPDMYDVFFDIVLDVSSISNKNDEAEIQKTYLMIDSNTGLVKIGKSKHPKKREKTLQSEKPTIDLLAISDKNIESLLHKRYEAKRVRGEWFSLSKKDLNILISHYNFKIVNTDNG